MTIQELENEVAEEFAMLSDWTERYEHIILLGKSLPLIPEQLKTDDLLIKGCQSRVWLHARHEGGLVHFTADSDAIITKGIISLLIRVLSGHSAEDIVHAELTFVERIGLKEHLSPTRSNGLVSMIRQMKLYALAFKAQHQKS